MSTVNEKLSELSLSSLIRILREVTLLGVLAYLSTQLFSGDLSLNFAILTASELVGMLLAFFSIALSAAFYFAATNQSNQFYDNVNNFTKDTSELLGRLDEQVKGLGGRQTELRDSIDKYYSRHSSGFTERASETVEAKAKETEEQMATIVTQILDRANLPAPERAAFERQLKDKDAELSSLRDKLARLGRRPSSSGIKDYLRRKIANRGLENALQMSPKLLLLDIVHSTPSGFKDDLIRHGFLSSTDISSIACVTPKGEDLVISTLQELTERP